MLAVLEKARRAGGDVVNDVLGFRRRKSALRNCYHCCGFRAAKARWVRKVRLNGIRGALNEAVLLTSGKISIWQLFFH